MLNKSPALVLGFFICFVTSRYFEESEERGEAMGPHRYFVQIADKQSSVSNVQEIEPKVFSWIQQLPLMDTSINEPNLMKLERYSKGDLFQPTGNIQSFYAGVAKMSDNSLVLQYHYFLEVRPVKLRGMKRKPFLIKDYAEIKAQKTGNGDGR